MHQYIGGQWAYSFFNLIGFIIYMISSLFLFKSKSNTIGLWSKHAIWYGSRLHPIFGKCIKVVLILIETLIVASMHQLASSANRPFGALVGTGANYFAVLFILPVAWTITSCILAINPLKQIDISTISVPIHLIFIKIACYCQGCCWGIPWEHGPYNHNVYHPGNQVPVQAIEAVLAIVILIFLLIFRRKAKSGQIYPAFLIAYSVTRFPVEFLSAAHEKISRPFNTYHFLCIAGIAVGVIMLIINKYYGERMMEFFERPHKKLEEKENELKCLEEEAMETNEIERKEKIRLAREKAKARRKK